jgi:hypothetical protein
MVTEKILLEIEVQSRKEPLCEERTSRINWLCMRCERKPKLHTVHNDENFEKSSYDSRQAKAATTISCIIKLKNEKSISKPRRRRHTFFMSKMMPKTIHRDYVVSLFSFPLVFRNRKKTRFVYEWESTEEFFNGVHHEIKFSWKCQFLLLFANPFWSFSFFLSFCSFVLARFNLTKE